MTYRLLGLIFFVFTASVWGKPVEKNTLTLILDWYLNPNHAPLVVAEQEGYFSQQNLNVKLIAPSDPNEGPKLVAAKKADMAVTYQPQLLMQVDQGLPLMRVGSLVDTPLNCLVTLRSKGIHSIRELKGKTIGYSAAGVDEALLESMLAYHHLNRNDITLVNVRYNLMQALLAGSIDAFTGGMRNVEPIQLNLSGHPAKIFLPEQNGFPSYEELIFIVHQNRAHDPRWTRFFIALQQGIEYLKQHPEESWQKAIHQYPELDNPLNKASWAASIQYFSKNPVALDKEKYQTFAEFMKNQNLIQKVPELTHYTCQIDLNSL